MYNIRNIKKILGFEDTAYFETINSTNTLAGKMARAGKDNFLIIAKTQTEGKGRHSRKWHSPEGGIYFSFALNSSKLPFSPQLFSVASSIGVMDFLSEQQVENVEYRWPNDILVNGRKICGILCELVDSTIITGIGFNLNNEIFDEEIEKIATSLYLEKNMTHKEEYALIEIVLSILKTASNKEKIYRFLKNNPMTGKRVSVKTGENSFSGKVAGIKETGEIVIETEDGEMQFFAGDIEILRGE